jgi:hypothetical protein
VCVRETVHTTPVIHTIQEADVSSSPPVRGEPALGGGVGVGAGGPPVDGEGMDLDTAGAADGARSGVGGLCSGQMSLAEVVDRISLSAAGSARPSADYVEAMDVVGDIDRASDLADLVAPVADSPSPAPGAPAGSFNHKQRRAWLRDQNRKGSS